MKVVILSLLVVALFLVLSEHVAPAEAGLSSRRATSNGGSGSNGQKDGSCPGGRGYNTRGSHGGNGGGNGGSSGGQRCTYDRQCRGIQKCCSGSCSNPAATVG